MGRHPNLILNATANPDFSQVEADVAQLEINRRFAFYYPEKRPFFLEGGDFFLTPINAVFTRTVADPAWGVKMTGKMGRTALGFFTAQDEINNLLLPGSQGSMSLSLDQRVYGVFSGCARTSEKVQPSACSTPGAPATITITMFSGPIASSASIRRPR